MSAVPLVTIAVEGTSDVFVLRRLLRDHGLDVHAIHGQRGKAYLDQKLGAFNAAAQFAPWLVLRDLDHDAPCAAGFVSRHLPEPSAHMHFRLAVPSIEAWLLADAAGFSRYFAVPAQALPTAPERLRDAKLALMSVVRKSRSRAIRQDVLPAKRSTAAVGPGYVAVIGEFVQNEWSWRRAARRSESLQRCVRRIESMR